MYFDFLTKSCSTLFQNLIDEFPSAYHVEYDVQWVETLSKGSWLIIINYALMIKCSLKNISNENLKPSP